MITKEDLKNDYNYFYKQVVLDKSNEELVRDTITDLSYCRTHSPDIRYAKKLRALIELIDKHREDFPEDWKFFINYQYREKAKVDARKLFTKEDINGLDMLMKAYWGRTIVLDKWQNIMNIMSFSEYASHFTAAILLDTAKNGSFKNALECYHLTGNNNFLNKVESYIREKYKPMEFKSLKMFPGYTHLENTELINLKSYELDISHKKIHQEYIAFIKSY